MRWDKDGAVNALDAKECFICGSKKPIHVVATVHGKKDLHFPCCSPKCLETLQEMMFQIMSER